MMMRHSLWKRLGFGLLIGFCAGGLARESRAQGFTPGGFGGGGGGVGNTGGTAARTTGRAGGGNPIGNADITVDTDSRRLIVVTDDKTAAQIKEVISGIDRPAPQVLIKVVFLEATYSQGSDIGFTAQRTERTGSGGITNILSQAFGTGLGTSAAALAAPGAGIYSILGQDFQATLRAIATAGKTEVLSRPSVLTRNNQPAVISLGQQVPLITNTRFDNLGNQINTVTYQNVGIILNVTPFITSDGMVEMTVTPEISALADRSQWVPISGGTNSSISAPVINSRTATTTVVVPDSQTAIIGGLMENQVQNSESKVPVLGDIPILGNLFKQKIKSNVKRELIIFLTPHIVNHPSQLAGVAEAEKGNKEIAPKAFSEFDMNRFLDTIPKEPAPPARGIVTPPAAPARPAPARPAPTVPTPAPPRTSAPTQSPSAVTAAPPRSAPVFDGWVPQPTQGNWTGAK